MSKKLVALIQKISEEKHKPSIFARFTDDDSRRVIRVCFPCGRELIFPQQGDDVKILPVHEQSSTMSNLAAELVKA
ncbi:MAG: hypothetical protein WCE79_28115 [Xanthobacteraceae bacterium]